VELLEGREALEEALDRLENIAKVLDTVSSFLQVIGKVVPWFSRAGPARKRHAMIGAADPSPRWLCR
jgi:hypothetical protein